MRIDIKGVIVSDSQAWIYDYFDIPYYSPKNINDLILKANGEELEIFINSEGGDIFAGSEIYSAIRSYKGNVKIHVVGLAASAASVIACAGQSDISPTAMLMVHNVSMQSCGDYHEMDKSSEVLKKANETIANAYVAKTGMSMDEALELMDKETWLSANDAVKLGLIDSISESQNVQLVASCTSNMIPQAVINKMMAQKAQNFENAKTQTKLNLLKMKGGI